MKNRNCPNKDMCWDYNASRCDGCAVGEKIARLVRQKKKLKAENAALRERLGKAVESPRIIHPNKNEWHIQYQYQKCGKGCMPECEYFTTGGCISPFNCPWKIGTGYIITETSLPEGSRRSTAEKDKGEEQ